jgi:hypothetical protein
MSLRVSCLCGESRVGLEVPNPCQTIIEIGRAREGMLKLLPDREDGALKGRK